MAALQISALLVGASSVAASSRARVAAAALLAGWSELLGKAIGPIHLRFTLRGGSSLASSTIAQLSVGATLPGAGGHAGKAVGPLQIDITIPGESSLIVYNLYYQRFVGTVVYSHESVYSAVGGLRLDAEWVGSDPVNPGIQLNAGSQLLYAQGTGLEKAWADVEAYRLTSTYAELVRDQWDPYKISARNLGYLAWAVGVNLWEDDWSEAFKRNWIANQWTYKYQRGSLLGLKTFVTAGGAELRRAITPPAITYPLPSFSDEDRAAYVARFPQLRLYPFVERSQLPYLCFFGRFRGDLGERVFSHNGSFFGPVIPMYPTNQDAGGKYTRTATIWDRGSETTLTVRKITKVITGPSAGWGFLPGTSQYDEQVVLPMDKRLCFTGLGFLSGDAAAGVFPNKETPLRTVTLPRSGPISLVQAKAIYQTILPRDELINLYPDHVTQSHLVRSTELYTGRKNYLSGKFLPRSNAWQFLYERWYLFDPDRVPDSRKANVYLGHCRLGIPNYTAEALIKITTHMPTFRIYAGGYVRGFLKAPGAPEVDKVYRAVLASMAVRDTVLVDTTVTRKIQLRDVITADGRHTVGQFVEN